MSLKTFYTAFHKNIPAGISGCRKKRLNNGTFFLTTTIKANTQALNISLLVHVFILSCFRGKFIFPSYIR